MPQRESVINSNLNVRARTFDELVKTLKRKTFNKKFEFVEVHTSQRKLYGIHA